MIFDPNEADIGFVHLFSRDEHMPEDTWMLCGGQDMDIELFPVLFTKIGYTFGGEKGYFKLPNFKPTSSLDQAFVEIQNEDFITDRYGIKVK